jgi:hypothetical protein
MSVARLSHLLERSLGGRLRGAWCDDGVRVIEVAADTDDLRLAIGLEPLLAGLAADLPHAQLYLREQCGVSALFKHRTSGALRAPGVRTLHVDVGGFGAPHIHGGRLQVPWAAHGARATQVTLVRMALQAGIAVPTRAAQLRTSAALRRQASRKLRAALVAYPAEQRGPIVVFANADQSDARHPGLVRACARELGATVIALAPNGQRLPVPLGVDAGVEDVAGLLYLASVVVAGDDASAHLAAALGIPVVSLLNFVERGASPIGKHCVSIVEEHPGEFQDLKIERIVQHVVQMASHSFPWDWIRRLLP